VQILTNDQSGKVTAGSQYSCWFAPYVAFNNYYPLEENIETDVVIVGAGIVGLSIAYCLSQAGKKVIVIEDGFIGSGETGRTTAQLVTALDQRYYEMEEIFGKASTKLIAESHKEAIEFVKQTIVKENIDCDFQQMNGYLFAHPSDHKDSLKKEMEAAVRAGIKAEEMNITPGISNEGASICFVDQAQFHPMKYLHGLCMAIEKNGGKIYTQTHAKEINSKGITTYQDHTVKAQHIVIATNAPVNDMYAMMLKQTAVRSYVIGALLKKDSLPKAMWWDTGDLNASAKPYHYIRTHSYNETHDLLLCGGEDHPVGMPTEKDAYKSLENWTRERFSIDEIISKWSGQIMVSMDSVAFIGRNPWDEDNVYIVTGDSGIGMTYSAIAGVLIKDLIIGNVNKYEKIYSPSRFTLNSSGKFFKLLKDDFINLVKKWFYTGSQELSGIKKGDAAIVKLEGEKCGAYCDENGILHIVSAECTHLKCMVVWNKDERSWDCPCHGSRFTYTGKVINGPAITDLPAYSHKITLESQ